MTRRLVLVTGASAGIGEAFARAYAKAGWDVALAARRADRLDALARELREAHNIETFPITADLSEHDAPAHIVEAVTGQGRAIDGLVNNAGFGLKGGFSNTDWEAQAGFLQLMVTAPTELCHRVFKPMMERGFGRIINLASLAALMPGVAGHTLYAPAKVFLVRLSEALNAEGAGRGVHVTALCPGFTHSEFHDVNGMRETVSKGVPKSMWQTAGEVAEIGMKAVDANVPVRVCGGRNKLVAGFARLLPDPILHPIMARQAERFRDAGEPL